MGDTLVISYLVTCMRMLHDRITADAEETEDVRRLRGDAGMTTEMVIITAGLAALALAVVAIIVTKVTNKAESIPTQ